MYKRQRSFIITAGQQSGIRSVSSVVINTNLVGKVVDVAPYYSVVQIITGRNSKTPIIFIESREKGIVSGSMISADDLTPVSYTHLDVYKRQPQSMLNSKGMLTWKSLSFMQEWPRLRVLKWFLQAHLRVLLIMPMKIFRNLKQPLLEYKKIMWQIIKSANS